MGFMIGNKTDGAFLAATGYLKIVAVFYVFCFTGNTFAGYFDGIGRVNIPFIGYCACGCHQLQIGVLGDRRPGGRCGRDSPDRLGVGTAYPNISRWIPGKCHRVGVRDDGGAEQATRGKRNLRLD